MTAPIDIVSPHLAEDAIVAHPIKPINIANEDAGNNGKVEKHLPQQKTKRLAGPTLAVATVG